MGMGESHGDGRALSAAKMAIQSPFWKNLTIDGAKGLLVNISGNKSITLFEVKTAMDFIKNAASADARFLRPGVRRRAGGSLLVTVIATGFPMAARGEPSIRAPGRPRRSNPFAPWFSAPLRRTRPAGRRLAPASVRRRKARKINLTSRDPWTHAKSNAAERSRRTESL